MSVMEYYISIQEQHLDKIILCKIGAFFEILGDRVGEISERLGIKETSRSFQGNDIPLCGFPVVSRAEYIKKLLDFGYSVVIVNEDDREGKKKNRFISDIITPSTAHLYEDYSYSPYSSYVASIGKLGDNCLMLFLDPSTGEVFIEYSKFSKEVIVQKLSLYNTKEIAVPLNFPIAFDLMQYAEYRVSSDDILQYNSFSLDKYEDILTSGEKQIFYQALAYLRKIKENINIHISSVDRRYKDQRLTVPFQTLLSLSIISNKKGDKNTLFDVLNHTKTLSGRRMLRSYLINPITKYTHKNLESIGYFIENSDYLTQLQKELEEIYDIERIIFRIINTSTSGYDIINLIRTIKSMCRIICDERITNIVHISQNLMLDVSDIQTFIADNIEDSADTDCLENMIKLTANPKFSKLMREKMAFEGEVEKYLTAELGAIGIVKINLAFNADGKIRLQMDKRYKNLVIENGYYLANEGQKITITSEYLQQQSLKYSDICGKITAITDSFVEEITQYVVQNIKTLKRMANIISHIDIIQSFANQSKKYNWVKPNLVSGKEISIKNGYHPIYNAIARNAVVKNDCQMGNNLTTMVITGSNMSGKSTYIKQVGIICFMANIGCYVPCEAAEISTMDAIFTRIGTNDNLYENKSTFFVEIEDIADMINNATNRSLCLIDEFGRGTAFEDGLDLSQKALKYININIGALTLCSTHIYQLTELERKISSIGNFHFKTELNANKDCVFTYKIERGSCNKSYAHQIARMVGLPDDFFTI